MGTKKIDPLWPIIHAKLIDCYTKGLLTAELIAEFTTASPSTVTGWIEKAQPANGERVIKLWHLMAACGLSSREFDEFPEYNRLVSELFGYGLIGMTEVRIAFGHQNASTAFHALRGHPVLRPGFTLEELRKMYDELLNKAKAELRDKLAEIVKRDVKPVLAVDRAPYVRKVAKATPVATVQPAPAPSVPLMPTLSVTDGVSAGLALASLLGAALPLARHLDDATPEERSAFRAFVGAEVLFDLSNLLNRLCGERARSNTPGARP